VLFRHAVIVPQREDDLLCRWKVNGTTTYRCAT